MLLDNPRGTSFQGAPEAGRRVVNLTFHGIGPPPRRLGPGERGVWLTVPTFLAMLDAVAERTDVALTFDDGNASDVAHALPALQSRSLKATFFLAAGRLGEPGFLGAEDVRQITEAGMAIGSHGMRHRAWRGLEDAALREELVAAREMLVEAAGVPVTEASCPFGSYDRRVLSALRRCGYERVYSSDRGTARRDAWLQARNTVEPSDDRCLIERIVAGDRRPGRALVQRMKLTVKRWR
jgi:peptidoglycan/xylan/chitin deacetylase (PgdA/CDA1 family)